MRGQGRDSIFKEEIMNEENLRKRLAIREELAALLREQLADLNKLENIGLNVEDSQTAVQSEKMIETQSVISELDTAIQDSMGFIDYTRQILREYKDRQLSPSNIAKILNLRNIHKETRNLSNRISAALGKLYQRGEVTRSGDKRAYKYKWAIKE